MKIKIKTFNGELPSYLTLGKEYEAERKFFSKFVITNDEGNRMSVSLDNSKWLNGGSWEVVSE